MGMASHDLVLTVSRKTVDNEARSALEALRVKMGLGEAIRSLARDEVWELAVEAPSAREALEGVRAVVTSTNLFANPNKHRYLLAATGGVGGAARPDSVTILVSGRDGAEGAGMVTAVNRLGGARLVRARRWTRWLITLGAAGTSESGIDEIVRRCGVVVDRENGLLCNPHSEIGRIVLPSGEEKPLAG
jgi:hypothetical protein